MQRGRIEVRSVRPHQHSDFGIDPNLVKQVQVTPWAVQLPNQNRLKIDDPLGPVVKANAKCVRREDFETADSISRMSHRTSYSGQELPHHIPRDIGQPEIAPLEPVSQPGVVETHQTENGGVQVVDLDRFLDWIVA